MRVLHFSDVHVGARLRHIGWKNWLSKRGFGGVNILLGRGKRFAEARRKLGCLAAFARDEGVDLAIFTGDYTALGLDREFEDARAAVEPLMALPLGYVNVPGNHDLYVPSVVRGQRFERRFGDTLDTHLPEHRVDGRWPLVRLVGDEVAVVAVNSSRPNPPMVATGRVPPAQLEALRGALLDERVRDRFVFVITHFAPRLADGTPDRRFHGLREAEAYLDACAGIGRGALLCGHVHHRYCVCLPGIRPPLFCAGSATMSGREGLWIYDLSDGAAKATPGRWDGEGYALAPEQGFEICPSALRR